ncbi:hypothetical protein GDO78_021034 [Eleutherodactylus coqui]|uniref:Uncharacterized protein n=1 Tax=Eleutherodactylus coqui TaxID=57060 RepID=A0A8J6EH64_ELECQ|nr:hypothetical protein GDO78_021034 [Eleutherodactylus coqui]
MQSFPLVVIGIDWVTAGQLVLLFISSAFYRLYNIVMFRYGDISAACPGDITRLVADTPIWSPDVPGMQPPVRSLLISFLLCLHRDIVPLIYLVFAHVCTLYFLSFHWFKPKNVFPSRCMKVMDSNAQHLLASY